MKKLFTPIYCAIIAFAVSLLALNAKAQAPITEYTFDNTLNNTAGNTPFPAPYIGAANRNQEANKALRIQSFTGQKTVTIPNLPLGTADRTIAMWYKILTVNPSNQFPSLFSYGEAATGKKFGFYLYGTGGIVHQGHGDDHTVNSVPTTLGDWYHLVVTFESQTVRVYINNVLRMQVARPTLNTGAGDFTIGGNFTGDIDDLSIYDRALSAAEVDYIYNDNPPTYWDINTNIGVTQATVNYKITNGNISTATIKYGTSPSALNANMALNTGSTPINSSVNLTGLTHNTTYYYQIEATNAHSTAQSQVYNFTTSTTDVVANFPFDNYSLKDISGTMQFNGIASFAFDRNNEPNAVAILDTRAVNIPNLPVDNADRTVSVWFNMSNYNGVNYPSVFDYGNQLVTSQRFTVYLERNQIGGSGGTAIFFNDKRININTALNTWYHLVVVLQADVMKMYLNNVLIRTEAVTLNTQSSTFKIGNASVNGAIDDLRIFSRALTEKEIRSLHMHNAMPPNPAVITYTFNNTYSNVSGTSPFATTSGTSFVADRYENPNSALRIENIGTTATIPNLPYGKAERTIAIWVTRNTNAGIFDINNIYHYGTGSQGYGLTVTPTSMGTVTEAPTHGAIGMNNPLNVWDHLVISYDGITSKVYKNGVLLSAEARNWNTLNDGDIFRLGLTNNGTNYFFDGTVDDLQIYNYVLTDAEVIDLYNATLPVNLVSFTAKAQNNAAVLNWQTASETNNSHFTVKHSTNGVDFVTLGNIAAKGANGASYQYIHNKPVNGTNYYQLLQVDLDGKTTDLGVKAINFGLPTSDIRLYPNPTTNQANVNFAQGTFHSAKLVNVNGQVLQTATIGKTQQTVTFSLVKHPNGVYFIKLQGNNQNSVQKVIKQ